MIKLVLKTASCIYGVILRCLCIWRWLIHCVSIDSVPLMLVVIAVFEKECQPYGTSRHHLEVAP